MAWLAVSDIQRWCGHSFEYVFAWKPTRGKNDWIPEQMSVECELVDSDCVELPSGSIKKLIGRELTWKDEPVEI